MTQPELDEATRSRIRVEEAERLQVRAELEAERRLAKRPNYWLGIGLNLLISGVGLMLLREVALGLLWLGGSLILSLAVSPWVAWPVGVLGSLLHYNAVYDAKYEPKASTAAESERQGRLTSTLLMVVVLLLGLAFMLIQTR